MQLTAEHAAKHTVEEETAASGCDPAGVIKGQSTGWNQTVQVRVMSQILRPSVQHGQHTDACAEMTWVGGDLEQCLGSWVSRNSSV